MAPSAAPGAPARALAARIARGSLRARPIPSRVASVGVHARAGGGTRPTAGDALEADASATRPTAVARLTASLGASTSTRRDVHVDRRADTRTARRERRDAKHARELGPHLGSANSPASVDAAMSREMAAMAGGVDALARRARDLALADERNLEVALRLASAAADVAAEELRDASLEAETDLDWPESSSSSADFLDAGSGSFHGSFDDASRTAAAARGILTRRERAQLCAQSVVDLSSKLSRRLIHDEWSACVAAFAAKDWRRDRKKPRVRPKDRRCNQPKARQGWNKRAMRETGVRVCVGCERMLPTTELIRVARMADADDDVDAEGHTIDTVEKDGEEGDVDVDTEKKKKKDGSSKRKWSVAIDPGSVAGSEPLLRMLVDGGDAAAAAKHPAAATAAQTFLRRLAPAAVAHPSADRNERPTAAASPPSRRRPTNALQGRAVYVCRRGACGRVAFHPKTRRAHRSLRAAGSFDPSFAAAAIELCVAAEVEDGVDSSHWVLDRAVGGVPGRAASHPRYVDERTGETAEGSDQTFLVWAAERSDFGVEAETDE